MTAFLCQRLSKTHDRGAFHCGVDALDEYLRNRARQDMKRRVAAVFVMVPDDEPQRIAGFYTLSAASVLLEDLPAEFAKQLPRYPTVPAALIGRLARDNGFPGVGRLLLVDALARSLQHAEDIASAVVLVDAKNDAARAFYAHYGFREMPQATRGMFLPMKTVETLLKADVGDLCPEDGLSSVVEVV